MNDKQRHVADLLFVIGLFVVFALSAFGVVAAGSSVYEGITENMTRNFDGRTAGAYLVEKVRANDAFTESGEAGVQLTRIDGVTALCLKGMAGEEAVSTYIYCYKGYLRELTVRDISEIGHEPLAAGEELFEAESLKLNLEDNGLFSFQLTIKSGEVLENAVFVRCR